MLSTQHFKFTLSLNNEPFMRMILNPFLAIAFCTLSVASAAQSSGKHRTVSLGRTTFNCRETKSFHSSR